LLSFVAAAQIFDKVKHQPGYMVLHVVLLVVVGAFLCGFWWRYVVWQRAIYALQCAPPWIVCFYALVNWAAIVVYSDEQPASKVAASTQVLFYAAFASLDSCDCPRRMYLTLYSFTLLSTFWGLFNALFVCPDYVIYPGHPVPCIENGSNCTAGMLTKNRIAVACLTNIMSLTVPAVVTMLRDGQNQQCYLLQRCLFKADVGATASIDMHAHTASFELCIGAECGSDSSSSEKYCFLRQVRQHLQERQCTVSASNGNQLNWPCLTIAMCCAVFYCLTTSTILLPGLTAFQTWYWAVHAALSGVVWINTLVFWHMYLDKHRLGVLMIHQTPWLMLLYTTVTMAVTFVVLSMGYEDGYSQSTYFSTSTLLVLILLYLSLDASNSPRWMHVFSHSMTVVGMLSGVLGATFFWPDFTIVKGQQWNNFNPITWNSIVTTLYSNFATLALPCFVAVLRDRKHLKCHLLTSILFKQDVGPGTDGFNDGEQAEVRPMRSRSSFIISAPML
jgi:hypothetical protein